MSGALADRTLLVTGVSGGIGLALARRCVAEGARVLGLDRRAPAPPEASVHCVLGDVRSPESWSAAVDAAERWAGGLDGVVLNAGVGSATPLLDADPAEIERVLGIDLLGVILGVRACVPALRRRGGGAIVATSSLAGLIPYPPDPVYAAARHGVVGLVRAIAPPLARDRITVNAVCPGLTDTAILPDEVRAAATRDGFPLMLAGDVAQAIVDCLAGAGTGQALVCQAGRPSAAYRFHGVPGPAGGARAPVTAAGLER